MSPVTVLTQQIRNGTYDSSSVALPLNADGTLAINPATGVPYQFVLISTTLSPADALLVTNKCILDTKATWDGANYINVPGGHYEWTGGSIDKQGNPSGPNSAPSSWFQSTLRGTV
jgi:hypothetical protein